MTLVAPRRLSATDLAALPLPLRLNTHTIAGEGPGNRDTLGTLTLTPAFLARLEAALRAELWEEQLPYSEWHRSPYVVARLAAAFGVPVLRAVLARKRALRDLEDDATYQQMDDWRAYRPYRDEKLAEAVAPFGFTTRAIERAERWIMGLLSGRLMGHQPAIVRRVEWQMARASA